MSFSNPNIFSEASSPAETPLMRSSPNVLAQTGAKKSIDATDVAVKGIVGTALTAAVPVAGLAFFTWWGFDWVLQGMFSGKRHG